MRSIYFNYSTTSWLCVIFCEPCISYKVIEVESFQDLGDDGNTENKSIICKTLKRYTKRKFEGLEYE